MRSYEAVDIGLDELLLRTSKPLGGELGPAGQCEAACVVVVCVDVRDPGNLGAVLRIAGATGVRGVICCAGTVDPFNPKVVRASAGAVFRVPLVVGTPPVRGARGPRAWRLQALGDCSSGGTDYAVADLGGPSAFVLGNEGAGLADEVVGLLDGALTIPMQAGTESLNVAMTVAVLCFEAVRRHRSAG